MYVYNQYRKKYVKNEDMQQNICIKLIIIILKKEVIAKCLGLKKLEERNEDVHYKVVG